MEASGGLPLLPLPLLHAWHRKLLLQWWCRGGACMQHACVIT
jgi:hypothetical protein